MTQAARSDLVTHALPTPARSADRVELAIATGLEDPTVSPALELQMALEDMLTASSTQVDYGRVALFGTGLLGGAALCLAFWWMALSWTAAVLG